MQDARRQRGVHGGAECPADADAFDHGSASRFDPASSRIERRSSRVKLAFDPGLTRGRAPRRSFGERETRVCPRHKRDLGNTDAWTIAMDAR